MSGVRVVNVVLVESNAVPWSLESASVLRNQEGGGVNGAVQMGEIGSHLGPLVSPTLIF